MRVVDISSWIDSSADATSRQRCAVELGTAMKELGMVAIVRHGIPTELFEQLLHASERWFEQPLDRKLQFSNGPYGCPEGGYTAQGIEAVAASEAGQLAKDNVDLIESFVFQGQPKEEQVVGFSGLHCQYYQHICRLLHIIHQILCSTLNVPDINHFRSQQIVSDEGHSLKISYYPNATYGQLRYGAHTDFQDITILKPDDNDWTKLGSDDSLASMDKVLTTGGLQVWDRLAMTWEPVILSDPTALCVNLGDFWNVWSHGHFVSPLHRVTGPWELQREMAKPGRANHNKEARSSLIFFSIPDETALIEPLPGTTCSKDYVERVGTKLLAESSGTPLTAGEYLAMKLARINS